MTPHVGTSGYSYPKWKGRFYPAKLPAKQMLGFYAGRFRAVEINASFYRLPAAATLEGWAAEVPADFRFAIKSPQAITHIKRLKDADEPVAAFLEVAGVLKDRGRQVALCIADETDELAVMATADWGYLRLRRPDYDDAALAA